MNGGPSRRTSSPVAPLTALLVLIIGVLAFVTIRLSGELSDLREQSATKQDLQAITDRLTGVERAVLAVAGTDGRSVSEVADDVEDLERAVFGFGGTPGGGFVIEPLQDRIEALEMCVSGRFSPGLRC